MTGPTRMHIYSGWGAGGLYRSEACTPAMQAKAGCTWCDPDPYKTFKARRPTVGLRALEYAHEMRNDMVDIYSKNPWRFLAKRITSPDGLKLRKAPPVAAIASTGTALQPHDAQRAERGSVCDRPTSAPQHCSSR